MALVEKIVGTSGQIQVVGVTFDGVEITTADSTAWTVKDDQGNTLDSGTLTYSSNLPDEDGFSGESGWFGNYNRPATPQIIHEHAEIVKNGATQRWHSTVRVVDFR